MPLLNLERLRKPSDLTILYLFFRDVKVMEDSKNSFLKGYGFVSFANQRDAERAIGKMDGTVCYGYFQNAFNSIFSVWEDDESALIGLQANSSLQIN